MSKRVQVEDVEAEPVIIGGMVLDINATPSIPANPRTTTPGKVFLIIDIYFQNFNFFPSRVPLKESNF